MRQHSPEVWAGRLTNVIDIFSKAPLVPRTPEGKTKYEARLRRQIVYQEGVISDAQGKIANWNEELKKPHLYPFYCRKCQMGYYEKDASYDCCEDIKHP